MKRAVLLMAVFILIGCVIRKEVYIQVEGSSEVGVTVIVTGSDLEDIKPELSIPIP